MTTIVFQIIIKKLARALSFGLGACILFLSQHVMANNLIDVGCISGYKVWLKPSESLEVSALPNPVKIKMAGVKYFNGEIPAACGGDIPRGSLIKIYTLDDKVYSIEIVFKNDKPHFGQFIQPKELSRMESSFRKNNFAVTEFTTNFEKGLRLGYQLDLVPGGYVERLIYKSPESMKYE